MIYVTGQLLDPMGEPEACVNIRAEALTSQVALLKSTATVKTDSTGGYSFRLVEGSHRIEVNFHDEYMVSGEVVVTEEMEGSTYSLPELLNLAVIQPI